MGHNKIDHNNREKHHMTHHAQRLRLALLCAPLIASLLTLPAPAAHAQSPRPACTLLAGLDLKPLLGADHDKPVEFGESSCRAESKAPGRMVIMMVTEKPAAELKTWLAGVRKMNTVELAKEVTVVPEPTLGAEAFSVREKGQQRGADIYALKGNKVVVLQADWSIGAPVTDAVFGQLRDTVTAALAKLP